MLSLLESIDVFAINFLFILNAFSKEDADIVLKHGIAVVGKFKNLFRTL